MSDTCHTGSPQPPARAASDSAGHPCEPRSPTPGDDRLFVFAPAKCHAVHADYDTCGMDWPRFSRHHASVPGNALTANQRAILLRLFAGETYEEVALQTGRKRSTIFNTTRRVRAQLGIRTEFDLMRECVRRGIVTLDEIYALADAIRPSPAR